MQMGCLHYYVIITHYYVITTQTSVITHYYPFQSPELADEEQIQLQQVPQHFDCARANGSLFAPQVELISFTLVPKHNSRIRVFLSTICDHYDQLTFMKHLVYTNFIQIFSILAGQVPTLVPKHNSRIEVFLSTIC